MLHPTKLIIVSIALGVIVLIAAGIFANRSPNHAARTSSSVGILTITSPSGEAKIDGDARDFAKALRLEIDRHGISTLSIDYTETFSNGRNSGEIKHVPYRGEIINGFYRFVYSESGDAVSANQDLDESIRIFLSNGLGLNGI